MRRAGCSRGDEDAGARESGGRTECRGTVETVGACDDGACAVSRGKVLAVSFASAFALAAIAVALDVVSAPPSELFVPTKFGASSTCAIMAIAGPVLALWGASVYVRCSDMAIRRYLVGIAAILVLWLLAVQVKYASAGDTVRQLCWYLYYVAIVFAPTLFLLAVFRLAAMGSCRAGAVFRKAVFVTSCVLVLLVLTNNCHMLVFEFDRTGSSWDSDYAYGLGYWVVAGWAVTLFAVSLVFLLRVAHRQLKAASLLIAFMGALAVVYCLLLVLRVEAIFRSNFSLTCALVMALIVELSLDLGLLPSFARYREAFAKLPFDAKILSFDGSPVFATECAKPLDRDERVALGRSGIPSAEPIAFKVKSKPDNAYKAYRLHGGVALLTEDRSEINRLIRELDDRREFLAKRNAVLERDIAVRRRLCKQERERLLMEDVSSSLRSAVGSIQRLLANLPDEGEDQGIDERKRCLMLVKLLVAYCKRKGSFVLSEKSEDDFDRERLQLAVNETVVDVRSVGIDCAVIVEMDKAIPVSSVSILYDCFYDVVVMAFECANPTLMLFISEHDECVELRIAMECDDEFDFDSCEAVEALRAVLDTRNVIYRLSGDVGSLRCIVVVAKEERQSEVGAWRKDAANCEGGCKSEGVAL